MTGDETKDIALRMYDFIKKMAEVLSMTEEETYGLLQGETKDSL